MSQGLSITNRHHRYSTRPASVDCRVCYGRGCFWREKQGKESPEGYCLFCGGSGLKAIPDAEVYLKWRQQYR